MLNAFRHQRKIRGCTCPTYREAAGRAQRLPASKEDTPCAVLWGLARCCAQRLPASKEETRDRRVTSTNPPCVLNAFRHQSQDHRPRTVQGLARLHTCSTPSGITAKITARRAFLSPRWKKCSTPSGITGKITTSPRSLGPSARQVLNAFRHHSKILAGPADIATTVGLGAQRLPASKEDTRRSRET